MHPSDGGGQQESAQQPMLGAELYLMCDDVKGYVRRLEAAGVRCSPLSEAPWGTRTSISLPSGGGLGLYQPKHPTAIGSVRD